MLYNKIIKCHKKIILAKCGLEIELLITKVFFTMILCNVEIQGKIAFDVTWFGVS